MGKLCINGVQYSSTSKSANNVTFNDVNSKLGANTVQDAIDILNVKNANLKKDIVNLNEDIDNRDYIHLSDIQKSVIVKVPASNWVNHTEVSGSSLVTQVVSVSGLKEGDRPYVGLYIPNDTTSDTEYNMKESAGYISYIDIANGSMIITCISEKPAYDFYVEIRGVY